MRRLVAALVAAALLLPAIPGLVAAKEGMMVAFDAPIPFGAPPGTELLVGMTVTALDEDGEHPVDGSPILLILTGRDGTETEAHGVEDRPGSGHYVARIEVPSGGARDARVVMRGMGSDGPADIELWITTDPFTFGGVTARTAQVAPAPTPLPTQLPRASAAPAAFSAAAPLSGGAAAAPPPGTVAAGTGRWWPPALVLVVLGLAVVIAVRRRFARRPPQGT